MTSIVSHHTRFAAAGVCLAALVACSGAGGSDEPAPGEPFETAATPEAAAAEPTSTPSTAALELTSVGTWHMANQEGYSYDLEVLLGPVGRDLTAPHPHTPELTAGTCPAEATAGVIPGALQARATTEGYPTEISARVIVRRENAPGEYTGAGIPPRAGDQRIVVAQGFSEGPSCSTFSSTNMFGYGQAGGFSVKWNTPVETGGVVTSSFFIIVNDFYGPLTPDGDHALLDWIVLRPMFGGDNGGTASALYADTAGMDTWGVYSSRGVTLNGDMIEDPQ